MAYSKHNPYAKRIQETGETHECLVCSWQIHMQRLLCDEHYPKTPQALKPKKGMRGIDYDRIKAYWWEQVDQHGYEPPIDRTMKV